MRQARAGIAFLFKGLRQCADSDHWKQSVDCFDNFRPCMGRRSWSLEGFNAVGNNGKSFVYVTFVTNHLGSDMVCRFEQVCRRHGRVLGCLGASVKALGGVLRRLGAFLGRLGGVLGGSWGRLGAPWVRLGGS